MLSINPRVEAELAAELDRVLNGRAPTAADLPALRYTESVILESMRMFPPAYGIGREAIDKAKHAKEASKSVVY